jgi:hypothetical protein
LVWNLMTEKGFWLGGIVLAFWGVMGGAQQLSGVSGLEWVRYSLVP